MIQKWVILNLPKREDRRFIATATAHGNRQVCCFHQAGNTFIPNGVSPTHQELCDTPISVVGYRRANVSISSRRTASDGSCLG